MEGESDDGHVPAVEGEAAEAAASGDVSEGKLLLDLTAQGEWLAAALDAAGYVGQLVFGSVIYLKVLSLLKICS